MADFWADRVEVPVDVGGKAISLVVAARAFRIGRFDAEPGWTYQWHRCVYWKWKQ